MPDPQLPTAEEAFGPAPPLPTAEEAFGPPEQAERQRYLMINQGVASSPLQDFLMSENGPVGTAFHSAGRIARSFGQDFSEEFSQSSGLSQETKDAIKRWTGYDSWSKKHRDIAKAASNVLLDRPALALSVAAHTIQGAFTGGQAAVAQLGEEVGQPRLGREIAAIPEAFMGTPHPTGMPGRAIAEAERLRTLGIEPGEAAARQRAMESFEARPRLPPEPPEQAEPIPAPQQPLPPGMPEGAVAEAMRTYAEGPPARMRLDPLQEVLHARALGVIGPDAESGWILRRGEHL